MNKNESLSNVERENEFIQTIFNFSHLQEKNSADRINTILTFIQNSSNGPNYFFKIIDFYSLSRPLYPNFSKLLVKCLYFCSPETQTNEEDIQYIKKQTEALKFIIFPETFQPKTTDKMNICFGFRSSQNDPEIQKKQDDLFSIISKDDNNSLDSFLKAHTEIDIHRPQSIRSDSKYYPLINWFRKTFLSKIVGPSFISLIDISCLYGSLKCFKYLLLNKCEITKQTLHYSIAGGNQEIINILKENGHSFEECLETSV